METDDYGTRVFHTQALNQTLVSLKTGQTSGLQFKNLVLKKFKRKKITLLLPV